MTASVVLPPPPPPTSINCAEDLSMVEASTEVPPSPPTSPVDSAPAVKTPIQAPTVPSSRPQALRLNKASSAPDPALLERLQSMNAVLEAHPKSPTFSIGVLTNHPRSASPLSLSQHTAVSPTTSCTPANDRTTPTPRPTSAPTPAPTPSTIPSSLHTTRRDTSLNLTGRDASLIAEPDREQAALIRRAIEEKAKATSDAKAHQEQQARLHSAAAGPARHRAATLFASSTGKGLNTVEQATLLRKMDALNAQLASPKSASSRGLPAPPPIARGRGRPHSMTVTGSRPAIPAMGSGEYDPMAPSSSQSSNSSHSSMSETGPAPPAETLGRTRTQSNASFMQGMVSSLGSSFPFARSPSPAHTVGAVDASSIPNAPMSPTSSITNGWFIKRRPTAHTVQNPLPPDLRRTQSLFDPSDSPAESPKSPAGDRLSSILPETPQEADEVSDNDDDDPVRMLLKGLERQNNRLAADPRHVRVHRNSVQAGSAALRSLIHGCRSGVSDDPSADTASICSSESAPTRIGGSATESPLSPTHEGDTDFWIELETNFVAMAARTPHLLAHRLRAGIPPAMRGRVWKASLLRNLPAASTEDLLRRYPRMVAERSQYAKIISRDLARTFPGVPLFAKAGGEGQRALGKVMRAYSVYDTEVGYCQGLGFLVGPLLMNMGEADAFCAFVRLMDARQLRTMFVPTMEGLHLRLHQFDALLRLHLPELHAHLESHTVPTALYASQWYLTMFAYTYPMRFVLRVWDVALAEGCSETVTRVGMALLERNRGRLMACLEFEELVSVLSKGLWTDGDGAMEALMEEAGRWSKLITPSLLTELEVAWSIEWNAKNGGKK